MNNKTIDEEYTILKSGTIMMLMYAVFINKVQNTKIYQKILCPNDTVLINSSSMEKLGFNDETDVVATTIQHAVKTNLKSSKSIFDTFIDYFRIF